MPQFGGLCKQSLAIFGYQQVKDCIHRIITIVSRITTSTISNATDQSVPRMLTKSPNVMLAIWVGRSDIHMIANRGSF